MKTLWKTLPLLALALAACGGAADLDDGDEYAAAGEDLTAPASFDPLSKYEAARTRAGRYTKNPAAVSLAGARRSGTTWEWVWTIAGDDEVYVQVAVAPGKVRTVSHESRRYIVWPGRIDPRVVVVDPGDVAQILKAAGESPATSAMNLGKPPQQAAPFWTATLAQSQKVVLIDATSGKISR